MIKETGAQGSIAAAAEAAADPSVCAECGKPIVAGQDHERTDGGVFCRECFDRLTAELQRAAAALGQDVNWSLAAAGGLLGGAAGVLLWWGFTVVTGIAFGLVAVVIGFGVGKGVVMLCGGKRHSGLQVLSAIIAVIAFFYASYLVDRSLIVHAMAAQGSTVALPWLPGPALFVNVVKLGFDLMDLVFLAIVLYEAWKIPAPVRLPGSLT